MIRLQAWRNGDTVVTPAAGIGGLRHPRIELWFDFASTYSYLTVIRIGRLRSTRVEVIWRPFLLGAIFKRKGLETSPFVLDAAKGRYMWRDVERRAARHGIPFRKPGHFPMNGIGAARIMTAAGQRPWAADFARAVLTAEFAHGEDIAQENVLSDSLECAGVDPRDWLASMRDDRIKAALRATTEEAWMYGIFGAPSFRVEGELFWGDDRLEDALAWAEEEP